MRGSLKEKRHLEGQQERRVQKERRARWSSVQSSVEGWGCFVSSYRLRVICLLQLCHPAVTRCHAPLCPGMRLPLPIIICPCVYSTFYTCRLLAWKWAGSGYLSSMNQYESLSMPFPLRLQHGPLSLQLATVPTFHPSVFLCLLIKQDWLYMMKVFFSKLSWTLTAVVSQWKSCAFSRHQDNLQFSPPQLRRVRASITQSLSLQTAILQPTTCDSDWGELWLRCGFVGVEQPVPWAQPANHWLRESVLIKGAGDIWNGPIYVPTSIIQMAATELD